MTDLLLGLIAIIICLFGLGIMIFLAGIGHEIQILRKEITKFHQKDEG